MPKKIILVLVCIGMISFFFTIVQRTPVPPCFNADEAAFGYNAFSLLQTGKDEYGTFLPLRLKSFGDYKMPLYSYLSIPFVAVFGLNELGVRGLNILLSFFFPYAVYLLAFELFKNKRVGIIAALLCSVSLGLHIISRQAHEAYLAAVLTTFTSYFYIKALHRTTWKNLISLNTTLILLLFSYHPGRLFAVFFFSFALLYKVVYRNKILSLLISLCMVILFFSISDLVYNPTRLNSLAFFNNPGFSLKINELKIEGGIRYLYHPMAIAIKEIVTDHLTYFSPQFLVQNGDNNNRFGFDGMSLITPVEYVFLFIGLYYLLKKKEKWRWFFFSLLFISPLSASLAWSKASLTRTLFLLVPISISCAYGFDSLITSIKKQYKTATILILTLISFFFLILAWDFYLFHYPKRLITIHSWQCGYKEINQFVTQNYSRYDSFYITRQIGMPYIFMLFYQNFPPQTYQRQAALTGPDEYGFGQVENFDKYIFSFTPPGQAKKGSVIIGSIDDFKGISNEIDETRLRTIAVNGEPMFQIYEVN